MPEWIAECAATSSGVSDYGSTAESWIDGIILMTLAVFGALILLLAQIREVARHIDRTVALFRRIFRGWREPLPDTQTNGESRGGDNGQIKLVVASGLPGATFCCGGQARAGRSTLRA